MEEFKIIKMGSELTEKEIKEAEDFGQLLKKHQRFVKKKKWIVGGVIAAGVFLLGGVVLFFQNNENKDPISSDTTLSEIVTSAINKPFELIDAKDTLWVSNQLGDTLKYGNTKIIIPAHAFVDSNGEQIIGNVAITYEEYHTPVEAFISGIPMTYDSAGIEFHFETAGMFDIRGFYGKTPVLIDKPLEVRLASKQAGDYYNKYFFNEESKAWEFISKDSIEKNEPISIQEKLITIDKLNQVNRELAKVKKREPQKRKRNSVCVKLEVDSTEFPEFDDFKELLFELDESEKSFKKEFADIEWDDAKLKRNKDNLEIHVFRKFKKTILKVNPVYEGLAFENAMSRFESVTKQKSDSLTKKKKELKAKINSFSNGVKPEESLEGFVTRVFSIGKFGVYNSDFPQKMPKGQLLMVEYLKKSDNPKKDTLKLKSLYLVEEDNNALFSLSPSETLSFNPNNKSVLWGVTMDNKLAIFKSDYFDEIPRNYEGIYNLEFDLVEKDLFTKDTIVKQLDIEALFNTI